MYSLSSDLETFIQSSLKAEGFEIDDAKSLAQAVKKLSDFYIQNPKASTPWHEKYARVAYTAYFLPLNFLRLQRIADKCAERGFFNDLEHLVDFGAGLATATASLSKYLGPLKKRALIEISPYPNQMIAGHWESLENAGAPLVWHKQYTENLINNPTKTLSVFSYSLTELAHIPAWALDSEALLIVEPATQEDGRRLLQWRNELIEKKFHVFAPCTHQNNCPLLDESKNDWCHDRIHVDMPTWFKKMEEFLPIKNKTLTVSYLAIRKTKPQPLAESIGRLTGDLLRENGKDRQLICRGSKREFLAWMHRHGEHDEFKRGDFYELDDKHEVRSNELRVPK